MRAFRLPNLSFCWYFVTFILIPCIEHFACQVKVGWIGHKGLPCNDLGPICDLELGAWSSEPSPGSQWDEPSKNYFQEVPKASFGGHPHRLTARVYDLFTLWYKATPVGTECANRKLTPCHPTTCRRRWTTLDRDLAPLLKSVILQVLKS